MNNLTCFGLQCEKILGVIKKEKNEFYKMVAYQKEILITKKYLSYGETVVIESPDILTNNLVKKYIGFSQDNIANITLT